MLKCDYKFWFITRDDDGFITEAAIRFFEGEITTEDEPDGVGDFKPITRYRRTKRLEKTELTHLENKFITEASGSDAKMYHPSEFGQIKTDDELRLFLNNELDKDKTRENIDEQKELLDINLVK